MKKIVSIIPARGGSKGIPLKNIRNLNGIPLICHTIRSAINVPNMQHVIVSTDDQKIAEISNNEGIIVVKRPPEISKDESPTIDAIFHTLDECKKLCITPDIIILLQPTSPLRSVKDIHSAILLYLENECDSVISVTPAPHPPYWNMIIEDPYLKPIFNPDLLRKRRQDLPEAYMPNGAIYISSLDYLKKERSFYGERVIPYIMPADRSIDIDSEMDFLLAELFIQRKGIRNETNTDCR